jgi:hypothetical protein
MAGPNHDLIQRALYDERPGPDELHDRLARKCLAATEHEQRNSSYAVPEWVELFSLRDAGIQSGHRLPKRWPQCQRRRHWGWLVMWFWLPIEWWQMRREPLPPDATIIAQGIRWPWRS